jgi:hypothetical protein
MSDSEVIDQEVWIIPGDPSNMAPLPAIFRLGQIALYDRKQQVFGKFSGYSAGVARYATFEECRTAMLTERSGLLEELNATCRELAASIEHTRTIPTATFPNVQREVREEQQGQEKAQAEEKVPDAGEKVKPALTQPPSRKTGGKVDPKTPIV